MSAKYIDAESQLSCDFSTTIQKSTLLQQTGEELDNVFPGFLRGDFLRQHYEEANWIPSEELQNSMLFAGCGSIEGLKEHVLTVLQEYPHFENYKTVLEFVERQNKGVFRRTGEDLVAHIYRVLLRADHVIQLEDLDEDLAHLILLDCASHDLEEDELVNPDNSVREALIAVNRDTNRHVQFRRFLNYGTGNPRHLETAEIELEPRLIPFFMNAVQTLNSNIINPFRMSEYIETAVENNPQQDNRFHRIPYIIKALFDRPDNHATYFFWNVKGNLIPTDIDRIYNKALEGINMFEPIEEKLKMMIKNPRTISYFPSTWSKLVLLGYSPDEMYATSEKGLPRLRVDELLAE